MKAEPTAASLWPQRARVLPVLALALAVVVASGCGGSSGGSSDTTAATDTTTSATTGPDGAPVCADVQAPAPRSDGGAKAPTQRLDPEKTYRLVFATSCGPFTVTLDQASAPATTASLVSLARSGFYDDTVFHRIVPGFVIQGGDPTQRGAGGPGYRTVDTPPADAAYTLGVMAMAKTQTEAPGTSGSQFFIITGQDAGLPPDYAVVGKVTKGLEVVQAIGQLGDPSTEQPLRPVVIDTVTVATS